MMLARLMLCIELILLKLLHPPHNLALWFFELLKPAQSCMISPDYEWVPKHVRVEISHVWTTENIFASETVVPLCLGEGMAAINNNLLLSILLLRKHSTYATVTCISVKDKGEF